MPVDTGLDHTPKAPLKDIRQNGSVYSGMSSNDKDWTRAYQRALQDAENLGMKDSYFPRSDAERSINDRLGWLNDYYKRLEPDSYFRQQNVNPFDLKAQASYRDLILGARRAYLTDKLNEAKKAFLRDEYRIRQLQGYVDEYSNLGKRLGPVPEGSFRDNFIENTPPYNYFRDLPGLRDPNPDAGELEWLRRNGRLNEQ